MYPMMMPSMYGQPPSENNGGMYQSGNVPMQMDNGGNGQSQSQQYPMFMYPPYMGYFPFP